ncbi:MAG: hypothetical protein J5629_09640 [Muribaculaceae bacterium]|nr:hypothetical protein [Muribaculaceae bacterium]
MVTEKEVMTIIVRCIFHKAVSPTCDILCLGKEDWLTFLAADPKQRMRMALTKLNKTYLLGAVKELVWIPYDFQDVVKIANEM